MADLTEFSETHTHDMRSLPLVRGLLVTVVLLAAGVIVLAVLGVKENQYLNDRRYVADQRNERERVAICAILNQIPGGHPSIEQAKVAFDCAAR